MLLRNLISFNFKGTFIESFNICEKCIEYCIVNISNEEMNAIMHPRKSQLFYNTDVLKKKNKDPDSDIKIGSFHDTELCEIVGIYILYVWDRK